LTTSARPFKGPSPSAIKRSSPSPGASSLNRQRGRTWTDASCSYLPARARPLSSIRLLAEPTSTPRRPFCNIHANRQYHGRGPCTCSPCSTFLASSGSPRWPYHPVRGQSSQPAHLRCARKWPSHRRDPSLTPPDIYNYADSLSPLRLRQLPRGTCNLGTMTPSAPRARRYPGPRQRMHQRTLPAATPTSRRILQHGHHPPHRIALRHLASLSPLGSPPPAWGGASWTHLWRPPTSPSFLFFYKRRASLHFARRSPGSILTSNGWLSSTGPGPAVT
jgi:hypothetical protein